MIVFEKIEKINYLAHLLKGNKPPTISDMTRTLKVSRVTVFNYISEMRAMGAEIEYDRLNTTYSLNKPFSIEVKIKNE